MPSSSSSSSSSESSLEPKTARKNKIQHYKSKSKHSKKVHHTKEQKQKHKKKCRKSCSRGPRGPQGPFGATGHTGERGKRGPKGCQGSRGRRGSPGRSGAPSTVFYAASALTNAVQNDTTPLVTLIGFGNSSSVEVGSSYTPGVGSNLEFGGTLPRISNVINLLGTWSLTQFIPTTSGGSGFLVDMVLTVWAAVSGSSDYTPTGLQARANAVTLESAAGTAFQLTPASLPFIPAILLQPGTRIMLVLSSENGQYIPNGQTTLSPIDYSSIVGQISAGLSLA